MFESPPLTGATCSLGVRQRHLAERLVELCFVDASSSATTKFSREGCTIPSVRFHGVTTGNLYIPLALFFFD